MNSAFEQAAHPQVEGTLYQGKSSARQTVHLTMDAEHWVRFQGSDLAAVRWRDLKVSSRLGNTPRLIRLPGGEQFETQDNDGIDRLQRLAGQGGASQWVHRLEQGRYYILGSVVATVAFAVVFVLFGIPFMSKYVADWLPAEVVASAGQGVLRELDDLILQPSQLEAERQQALRQQFQQLVPENTEAFHYQIQFRSSPTIGANAFALPNGSIVFTDELIALANDDREIQSIMLHEIGHVVYRHNLRRVIQSSALGAFIFVITGDISSASSLLVVLPSLILEASFSQDLEREADGYALEQMQVRGLSPEYFADMMEKLQQSHHESADNEGDVLDYFGSHPPTRERIQRFRDAARSAK